MSWLETIAKFLRIPVAAAGATGALVYWLPRLRGSQTRGSSPAHDDG